MSKSNRLRKIMRREVNKSVGVLSHQMLTDMLKQPFLVRLKMAIIILFKRPI